MHKNNFKKIIKMETLFNENLFTKISRRTGKYTINKYRVPKKKCFRKKAATIFFDFWWFFSTFSGQNRHFLFFIFSVI